MICSLDEQVKLRLLALKKERGLEVGAVIRDPNLSLDNT